MDTSILCFLPVLFEARRDIRFNWIKKNNDRRITHSLQFQLDHPREIRSSLSVYRGRGWWANLNLNIVVDRH